MADRPIKELGDKTPLEAAKKPNINKLCQKSRCGTQNPMGNAPYPTSEEAHFGLFGYDYIKDLPGRGVLEALGQGVKLKPGELVFRVDFGSVDENLNVVDPRAGNIHSVKSYCDFLGEQKVGPFTFRVYPGIGHRGALVVSGDLVSKAIHHHSTSVVSDTDPHKAKQHRGGVKVIRPYPLENTAEARLTADALWEYLLHTNNLLNDYIENRVRKRQGLLPANFILTRGGGFLKPVKKFKDKYGLSAACVAGMPLYKGIGSYLGMDLIDSPGITGLFDTNLESKIMTALTASKKYDFVFAHFKGADVYAEESGDYEDKMKYIEKADITFKALLKFDGTVVITGDHATPCELKDHAKDPVPIMITSAHPDKIQSFSEKECAAGSLGHLKWKEIIEAVLGEANNV